LSEEYARNDKRLDLKREAYSISYSDEGEDFRKGRNIYDKFHSILLYWMGLVSFWRRERSDWIVEQAISYNSL
jgi:hypothetical protein